MWCQGTLSDAAEAAALSCRQSLDLVQTELKAASQFNLAACPPGIPTEHPQLEGESGRGGRELFHRRCVCVCVCVCVTKFALGADCFALLVRVLVHIVFRFGPPMQHSRSWEPRLG